MIIYGKSSHGTFMEPLVGTLGAMSRTLSKHITQPCFCVHEIHVQFVKVEQFCSSLNYKTVEIQ